MHTALSRRVYRHTQGTQVRTFELSKHVFLETIAPV